MEENQQQNSTVQKINIFGKQQISHNFFVISSLFFVDLLLFHTEETQPKTRKRKTYKQAATATAAAAKKNGNNNNINSKE